MDVKNLDALRSIYYLINLPPAFPHVFKVMVSISKSLHLVNVIGDLCPHPSDLTSLVVFWREIDAVILPLLPIFVVGYESFLGKFPEQCVLTFIVLF